MANNKFIFIIILVLALVVRFYNFPSWQSFDYDQEVNAWLAKSIVVDHKPILIGPETSVGAMHVGPYFNYVIALFFALGSMNPANTIVLNFLLSLTTVTVLYLAGKDLLNVKIGLIASAIYSFSWLVVSYSRVLWNPTPMPLVSLLTIWFMVRYLRRQILSDLVISAVAAAFSLQLHFQGVFLVGFFVVALLAFNRRKASKRKSLLVVIGVFLASLFPLLLFDLRHGWVNSQNFWQFFFRGAPLNPSITFGLLVIPKVLGQLFYAIFFPDFTVPDFWYLTIFIVVTTFLMFKAFMNRSLVYQLFMVIWLLVLLLLFYHGPLPLQYFLLILPVVVLVVADILNGVLGWAKWTKYLIGIFLVAALFKNLFTIAAFRSEFSLRAKQEAVKYIISDSRGQSFKVDFITDPGFNTGFKYLFWQQGKGLITDMTVPTAKTYKIIIPSSLAQPEELAVTFSRIGVVRM